MTSTLADCFDNVASGRLWAALVTVHRYVYACVLRECYLITVHQAWSRSMGPCPIIFHFFNLPIKSVAQVCYKAQGLAF